MALVASGAWWFAVVGVRTVCGLTPTRLVPLVRPGRCEGSRRAPPLRCPGDGRRGTGCSGRCRVVSLRQCAHGRNEPKNLLAIHGPESAAGPPLAASTGDLDAGRRRSRAALAARGGALLLVVLHQDSSVIVLVRTV